VPEDGKVLLQFAPIGDAEPDEKLLRLLGADIRDLQLGAVEFAYARDETGETKAGTGLLEWLGVALTAGRGLRDLLRLAGEWTQRAKHPVRVRIGEDELVLEHATTEQQNAIIEAFLARHHTA
jgi:hypothetical protein